MKAPIFERQVGPRITYCGSAQAWAGRTTLNSGSVFVTVSTPMIRDTALVLMGTRPSSLGLAANSGGHIVVSSIVNGQSFCFARSAGVAVPWNEIVTWEIVSTTSKPM